MRALTSSFERFKRNSRGFWRVYWWIVLLFVGALAADGTTTIYFMLKAGAEAELHPVIRVVSIILGPIARPVLSVIAKAFSGKAFSGIIVAVYCRRFAAYILIAGTIVSLYAAWYNIKCVHNYL